ncbi:VOC family protein [Paraburkholderia phymatum]|uniref:Glyoxalase/bleomycin resistance protein/dioxygenase n=1 Tax=Paraburkholderia phymatum (strain DSM 17167 / CIP 108236 / LMG 21445 / STM815) TaxID=391038 RepID=B2JLN8_PARP8|nr:VOC family protein [Paraburkholderia phymatum]ACC72671.1 Glyoxalase/bleomycin resistance protein/dioxygenase [Paraburkholderia phymatum STM815]
MLIEDIEFVTFRHPDLAAVRDFMVDYGLLDLQHDGDALYLRSYGDAPFSYVSTQGEAAFVGVGFRVSSREALDTLAARFDSPVTDCPHPGGGLYTVGADPDGRRLEFVFGAERLPAIPSGGDPIVWNDAHAKNRLGHFQRPAFGPSHIQRFGHVAVFSPDPQGVISWYGETLGMKASELIYQGKEKNVVAAFMHLETGAAWTDHHTLAIVGGKAVGLDHASFECRDIDDVGIGHMVMVDKGYKHRWGIGRHFHGSQIFDYWTDPAGFHVEHYVDGDLVNNDSPTLSYPFGRDTLLQWGPAFPGL